MIAADSGQTAFRAAEKKYQLHKELVIRHKKGRAHGTRLVVKNTDISDVLDLLDPGQVAQLAGQVNAHWCATLGATVYSFRHRSGLHVLPGALSPSLQCQLIVDALTRFPQGPSHTNFTNQHGLLPEQPNLWEAAQQGLCLQRSAAAAPAAAVPGGGPAQQQSLPQPAWQLQPGGPEPALWEGAQEVGEHGVRPSPDGVVAAARGDVSSPCGCGAGLAGHERCEPCRDSGASAAVAVAARSVWAPGDGAAEGVPAVKLLRKLRWATLGPPYDWTQRVYRRDVQYSSLPQYLADLATQLAAAVAGLPAAASSGQDGSCSEGAARPEPKQGPAACPARANAPGCGSTTAAATAALDVGAGAALVGCEGPVQPGEAAVAGAAGNSGTVGGKGSRPFCPDVALVNYYHEGDTLGGHVDDAERDLDQPIVTLSLGCQAVFLLGGPTRDVPPLALLLRSGDAVVMSGQARRCFHGVPRVLTDRPLPKALLEVEGLPRYGASTNASAGADDDASASFAPFLEYMRGCRINVSVRAVA